MERRSFFKLLAAAGLATQAEMIPLFAAATAPGTYRAAAIPNDYYRFLPGEREALAEAPSATAIVSGIVHLAGGSRHIEAGATEDGWLLVTVLEINGTATAVFEKRVTHRGAIAYVTADRGTIAILPTFIGDIATITPRPVAAPADKQLRRTRNWVPGPDLPGQYILEAAGDPTWETVAALGSEYIGWTLVGNQQAGPERSLFLEPDGTSRELNNTPPQAAWAPDELSPILDLSDYFPNDNIQLWRYREGWSKRTLLGGYTPTANIAVWNEEFRCGYEVAALLPESEEALPMVRIRVMVPDEQVTPDMRIHRDSKGRAFVERYKNCDERQFFAELVGIWNYWQALFDDNMPVEIPDENLRDSARAGIMLSRCSYRGLRPTYQIGEGAYTKIPERSHALFPVAAYEFIWAQQLWGLNDSADLYQQFYLDNYILPDGNFLYNMQDQVEAPLNVGLFLRNSARSFRYGHNLDAFKARMPALQRMIGYVLARRDFAHEHFAPDDSHYGLIWGSPEADLGDPHNDTPNSHPFYFQNAANIWRGLNDYAAALVVASQIDPSLAPEAKRLAAIAQEMRSEIERSLATTMARRNEAMVRAGITPFSPEDTTRDPHLLLSYENHRFMQDWFLADWGDPELDLGHLRHRAVAGMERVGLHMDGVEPRTSNFMEHGTLSVRIRQDDYRPFLLTLYGLVCFAADSGSRYSPEDALLPGGYAGEGNKYWWSAVINSVLQPTLGLRWLLCYEESDHAVCHLQKAAPCDWFRPGERIAVHRCPTRFGTIGWVTEARAAQWSVHLDLPESFAADLLVHIHAPDRRSLTGTSAGTVQGSAVLLRQADLAGKRSFDLVIR